MIVAIDRRKVYQIANNVRNRMGTSKERPGDLKRVFSLLYRYLALTKDGDVTPRIRKSKVNSKPTRLEHEITADDAIVLIEPKTARILYANTKAEHLWGYTNKQLLGMTAFDISVRSREETGCDLSLQTKGKQHHTQSLHRLANGEVKSVSIKAESIIRDGKKMVLTVVSEIPMAVAC